MEPDTALEAVEQPEGVPLKRVHGLWVHQGSAEPGADWQRILDDVRQERIESVLKA